MKILSAVLKFTLQLVFAALAGGAKTNDKYGFRPHDMVMDKNGDMKFRSENVDYY